MLTMRRCPECNEEIKFTYGISDRTFTIKNGEIVRDDSWVGNGHDGPYFDFYCSNNKGHDIETPTVVYEKTFEEWAEEIENEFIKKGMYAS